MSLVYAWSVELPALFDLLDLGGRNIETPPLGSLKAWHILLPCDPIPSNDNIFMLLNNFWMAQ